MVGESAEGRPSLKELAVDFDRIINTQGPIKASLLDNGLMMSTEITYLPNNTVVFEKHAPHLGFPYYFSAGPDGVFLDKEKTKLAEGELGLSLQFQRIYDPRAIAQIITGEEQNEGYITYDLKQFPGWPTDVKALLQQAPPNDGTAFYTVNSGRLYQLSLQNGEILTLRFIYPDDPDQVVASEVES